MHSLPAELLLYIWCLLDLFDLLCFTLRRFQALPTKIVAQRPQSSTTK